MPPQERDRERFYNDLVSRGIPKDEIERVYQSLRGKGYGEAEARRRSQIALERMRAERDLAAKRRVRRRGAEEPALADRRENATVPGPVAYGTAAGPGVPAAPAMAGEGGLRRAGDWLQAVPPRLRRRINGWAWRHGYLITRLGERLDDLVSLVDARRKDYASRPLVTLLAARRPMRGANPFSYSLIETLDALRESAGVLLGERTPAAPGRPVEGSRARAGGAALARVPRAVRGRVPL